VAGKLLRIFIKESVSFSDNFLECTVKVFSWASLLEQKGSVDKVSRIISHINIEHTPGQAVSVFTANDFGHLVRMTQVHRHKYKRTSLLSFFFRY
jgi:hypothetical protein